MKNFLFAGCFFIIACLLYSKSPAQGREEFTGPFDSWANVKTRFGAKGNGKTDDTKALQNAIDSLSNRVKSFNIGKGEYTVLYLPAGTYCISSTLVLRGKIGVSIIGEDPIHTIIKWIGKDKDTLFWANGSAYYKIARLTWDAGGKKDMEAIGIHWKEVWNDGKTMSFASLNIEIADNNFIGGFKYGISGGTYGGKGGTGMNDSEITIRRCVFHGCTFSGIEIQGFNALDYWIWDCRFLQCSSGVRCSHGNYHIYRSFFSGSQESDVHNNNGYYNSIRGCYSENSNKFSSDEGASSNPFKRIFQDNTVINPHKTAIEHYHLGKITLLGNRITKSLDTATHFSVYNTSWFQGTYEALSLHNTYSYKDPIKLDVQSRKIYSFEDKILPGIRSDSLAFLKSLDPTPPIRNRKILEVPAGANADGIQSVLNGAAMLNGQRPIVHFKTGIYYIDKTLQIPAGSDMQLIGDGQVFASMILKKGDISFANRPMLLIKGPSYITIADLQIGSDGDKGQREGIVFENTDQPGSQAFLDQIYSHADTSLFVDGMNYLYIEKKNSFFTKGNFINGGKLMQKGKGSAKVCCYGGQFAGLTVRQNASFLARDCWWEGSDRIPLDIVGSGKITVDGAMIAPAGADSLPTIRIRKFSGNISLMNMYVQGALWTEPDNPSLNLFVWNIHFYYKKDVLDFLRKGCNFRGAFLGLTTQCFRANDPDCKNIISIGDQLRNVPDINSFINEQTDQDRQNTPMLFKQLPRNTSNIFISRVSFGNMDKGIVFKTGV